MKINQTIFKVLALVMLVALIGCSKAEEKAESVAEKAGSVIKEKAAAVKDAMPTAEEAKKSMSDAASGVAEKTGSMTEKAGEMKDQLMKEAETYGKQAVEGAKDKMNEKIDEVMPGKTDVTAESVQKNVEDAAMQKAEETATEAMKDKMPGGMKIPSYK